MRSLKLFVAFLGLASLSGIQGIPEKPTIPFSSRSEFDTCEVITEDFCENELTQDEKDEIHGYQADVTAIVEMFKEGGKLHNRAYNDLVKLVDRWPQRPSGSEALEESIDYMLEELRKAPLDKVWAEQVMVPYWIRGKETAHLTVTISDVTTLEKELRILGLGSSVGTPAEGISGPVIVVHDEEGLDAVKDQVIAIYIKY